MYVIHKPNKRVLEFSSIWAAENRTQFDEHLANFVIDAVRLKHRLRVEYSHSGMKVYLISWDPQTSSSTLEL